MTAGEVYITVLAYAAGIGFLLALAGYAFVLAGMLLGYVVMLAIKAVQVVFTTVLPAIPHLLFAALKAGFAAIGKAHAARTARRARGMSVHEGEPEWQRRGREQARAEAAIAKIDGWDAACRVLGLPPEAVTKAALTRAYRKAMRSAHPDLGGSPARAKAINIARDLICKEQGWT